MYDNERRSICSECASFAGCTNQSHLSPPRRLKHDAYLENQHAHSKHMSAAQTAAARQRFEAQQSRAHLDKEHSYYITMCRAKKTFKKDGMQVFSQCESHAVVPTCATLLQQFQVRLQQCNFTRKLLKGSRK